MVEELGLPETPKDEVSLTEDILGTKKNFVLTFYEFLREEGEQIVEDGFSTAAGTNIIFTVPEGKTLYVQAVYASTSFDGVSAQQRVILEAGYPNVGTIEFLTIRLVAQNRSESLSLSFPIPIQIEERMEVKLQNQANMDTSFGFMGFLVSKEVLRRR